MVKDFVLVHATRDISGINDEPQVLVIYKDRPAWQKGRINLPGGGIEAGESPEQAACREFMEETGLKAIKLEEVGIITDRVFKIYVFDCYTNCWDDLRPRSQETEKVCWELFDNLMKDKRIITNLRVILPLIKAGVKGWVVEDDATASGAMHTMSVSVPTFED